MKIRKVPMQIKLEKKEIIHQINLHNYKILLEITEDQIEEASKEIHSSFFDHFEKTLLIKFTTKRGEGNINSFLEAYDLFPSFLKEEFFYLYFILSEEKNVTFLNSCFGKMKYFIDKKYFLFLYEKNECLFLESLFSLLGELNLVYQEDRNILEALLFVDDSFFLAVANFLLKKSTFFDENLLLNKKNLHFFSFLGEKKEDFLKNVDEETFCIVKKFLENKENEDLHFNDEKNEEKKEENVKLISLYEDKERIEKIKEDLYSGFLILKNETFFAEPIFDAAFPKGVIDFAKVITLCAYESKDLEFQFFLEEILEKKYFLKMKTSFEKFNSFLKGKNAILKEEDLLTNYFILSNMNLFKFTFPNLFSQMKNEFILCFENLELFFEKSKHVYEKKKEKKVINFIKEEIKAKCFVNKTNLSYEFKYSLENINFKMEFFFENINECQELTLDFEEFLTEVSNFKSFFWEYLRQKNTFRMETSLEEGRTRKYDQKRFTSTYGSAKTIFLLNSWLKKSNKVGCIINKWKEMVDKFVMSVNECAICYLKELNDKVSSMRCKQCNMFYHKDCFYQWMKKTKKMECAMCKFNVVE